MERKILFRAKSTDSGEWVEGSFIHAFQEEKRSAICGMYKDVYFIAEISGKMHTVDPETVCQYTGLIDETEKKIYEGDIVKTSQYGVDDGNGHNYAGFDTFSVKFSDGGFCLKNEWRIFNLRPLGNFEVIGNIFDDPELIED